MASFSSKFQDWRDRNTSKPSPPSRPPPTSSSSQPPRPPPQQQQQQQQPAPPPSDPRTQSLAQLASLCQQFHTLLSSFRPPPLSSLSFAPVASGSNPKLAFTKENSPVHGYEEALMKLLVELDGVDSLGDPEIRGERKKLVVEVNEELAKVEREIRAKAWELKQQGGEGGGGGKEKAAVERGDNGKRERDGTRATSPPRRSAPPPPSSATATSRGAPSHPSSRPSNHPRAPPSARPDPSAPPYPSFPSAPTHPSTSSSSGARSGTNRPPVSARNNDAQYSSSQPGRSDARSGWRTPQGYDSREASPMRGQGGAGQGGRGGAPGGGAGQGGLGWAGAGPNGQGQGRWGML